MLGHDVATEGSTIRALVGYMPEHDCLPADVSASDLVVHMGQMSGLPYAAARERASDVLRHVGLAEERYRPMGGYSTGMKQRAKLAQALVHDPRLVLLDEPTNGLDPSSRDDMLALVQQIGHEFGIAVLVTSHLLGELERVSDHVVVLDGGRLLQSSATTDFLHATGSLIVEVQGRPDADRLLGQALVEAGLTARPGRRRADRGRGPRRDHAGRRARPHRRPRPRPGADAGAAPPHRGRLPRGRCRQCPARLSAAAGTGRRHPRPRLPPLRRAAARRGRRSRGRSSCTGLRNTYGLGRSGRSKVLPMILLAMMLLPALILVGVLVQAKRPARPRQQIVAYSTYPITTQLLISVFVAAQAPALISRDLRFRTITLYLARPMRRSVYVLVRLASLAVATFILIGAPLALMYVGGLLADLPPAARPAASWAAWSVRCCSPPACPGWRRWSRR